MNESIPGGVTRSDLHAYVDGQLSRERAVEVDAWLQANPDDAEQVAAYARQNRGLHEMFDGVLAEPLPAALDVRRGRRRIWAQAAAIAGACLVGGIIGWAVRDSQVRAFAGGLAALHRQAAVAHIVYAPQKRHPVEVVAAEEAHLVAWLSKVLGAKVNAPSLLTEGFQLVGGRLVPTERGPGALFMYEEPSGVRLTLYVRSDITAERDTAFRFAQEHGVNTFYWVDNNLGYALTGEVDKTRLSKIANTVYKQLNP